MFATRNKLQCICSKFLIRCLCAANQHAKSTLGVLPVSASTCIAYVHVCKSSGIKGAHLSKSVIQNFHLFFRLPLVKLKDFPALHVSWVGRRVGEAQVSEELLGMCSASAGSSAKGAWHQGGTLEKCPSLLFIGTTPLYLFFSSYSQNHFANLTCHVGEIHYSLPPGLHTMKPSLSGA